MQYLFETLDFTGDYGIPTSGLFQSLSRLQSTSEPMGVVLVAVPGRSVPVWVPGSCELRQFPFAQLSPMMPFRIRLLHGYLRMMATVAIGVISSLLAYALTSSLWVGLLLFIAFSGVLLLFSVFCVSIVDRVLFFVRLRHYGICNLYTNQAAAAERIAELLQVTPTIDILGIRGLGIFALTDSIVHQALLRRRGQISVRILLLNPSSSHARTRAEELGEPVDSLRSGIIMARDAAKELQNAGVDLTVRLYDSQPVWRILGLGQTLFVSAFIPGVEGHDSPVLELTYTVPVAPYSAFTKHFNGLWASATPFNTTHVPESRQVHAAPPAAQDSPKVSKKTAKSGKNNKPCTK